MENENNSPQDNNEFNKEQFDAAVKDALQQAKKIGEAYRKYFEFKDEDKPSVFADIESRLDAIIKKYNELFAPPADGGATKVFELNKQVEEIKEYHQELIGNEDSIKAAVEDSQDRITKFFVYLFGGDDGSSGKESEIRQAIEDILSFQNDLNGAEEDPGYKKSIEDAHQTIIGLHSEIFDVQEEQKKSKADTLRSQIEDVNTYHGKLEDEIKPFISDTRTQIEKDKKSVKALLGSAIGPSLLDGFLESKQEYKQVPRYSRFENSDDLQSKFWKGLGNAFAWLWSKFIALLNYAFFIIPLLLSVVIFLISPEKLSETLSLGINGSWISELIPELEIGARLLISLPLWWIAWFLDIATFLKTKGWRKSTTTKHK